MRNKVDAESVLVFDGRSRELAGMNPAVVTVQTEKRLKEVNYFSKKRWKYKVDWSRITG